jgi:hypothetical protein
MRPSPMADLAVALGAHVLPPPREQHVHPPLAEDGAAAVWPAVRLVPAEERAAERGGGGARGGAEAARGVQGVVQAEPQRRGEPADLIGGSSALLHVYPVITSTWRLYEEPYCNIRALRLRQGAHPRHGLRPAAIQGVLPDQPNTSANRPSA